MMEPEIVRFAGYVATLGRGPGRSRALTRDEARDAMGLILAGQVDPVQLGAFLMLLRYRGEDPEEVTGLVQAARQAVLLEGAAVDIDWPSYGAGRTRVEPWFLLAALALAQSGLRVLMHGSNEFSGGMTVPEGLAAVGMRPASSLEDVRTLLAVTGFAYLPLRVASPALDDLLRLRRLLGLRSPVNTVSRLLDPANAACSVDGVFHPPYIETHLAVAERLGRPRLLVLKGGGGEVERNPAKPITVHLWVRGHGRQEILLPALGQWDLAETPDFGRLWRGQVGCPQTEARIVATIGVALLAAGTGGDAEAQEIWHKRVM